MNYEHISYQFLLKVQEFHAQWQEVEKSCCFINKYF
jgi:hypothetical protein